MKTVTAESYTLTTPNGDWLAQIVITSDGMISGVTDWGNFGVAFRSYSGDNFKQFLVGLNTDYFGGKIYSAMNYMATGRKFEATCDRIAEKILPALQTVLKSELQSSSPLHTLVQ